MNHNFTGTQQAEYDSLSHNARTHYDLLRWYEYKSHTDAYTEAKDIYGLKRKSQRVESPAEAELRQLETRLAMLTDPGFP